MLSEYRRFNECVYRLDVDRDGVFCKASKLVQGEWEPLELTLRAMLFLDSDGTPLSPDQILSPYVGTLEQEQG
ncbi:hypothetical protein ACFLYM_00185 [Chloroflexota bacterium]